jgi:hypothetical protein
MVARSAMNRGKKKWNKSIVLLSLISCRSRSLLFSSSFAFLFFHPGSSGWDYAQHKTTAVWEQIKHK